MFVVGACVICGGALQMAQRFRKLDASVQRDNHDLFTRSAGDLLDHWVRSLG